LGWGLRRMGEEHGKICEDSRGKKYKSANFHITLTSILVFKCGEFLHLIPEYITDINVGKCG
jgi:hypothetical protein